MLAGISLAEDVLQAAFSALLGGYYALQATGGATVSNGDYGDFGSWAGEKELGAVLRAVALDPALHPDSLRRALRVQGAKGSAQVYAALRTSATSNQIMHNRTVVLFNFSPDEAELEVDLSGTDVPIGQASVDIIVASGGGPSAPVPASTLWPTRLQGHGYAAFAFGGAV